MNMKRYIKTTRDNAKIGVWWYTDDGEIWAKSCLTDDGVPMSMYLQYSKEDNHLNLWPSVVKEHLQDQDAVHRINKGFKSFERGRVIFNCATCCYEIICSASIINNRDFRQAIIDYFNLSNSRFEFVKLDHYHKEELTGNPALDEFYYQNQL